MYICVLIWTCIPSEGSKVQNSLYLLCFLQFGELHSAKLSILTGLFAIRTDRTNAK